MFLQHGYGSQPKPGVGFSQPHPPQYCPSLQHADPHIIQPLEEELEELLEEDPLEEEELDEEPEEELDDELEDELDELLEEDPLEEELEPPPVQDFTHTI